jgi:Poly-beta-hydroxybutyrate polymerase (PhaC) N-terminus
MDNEEAHAGVMDVMAEAAEAAAGLLPLEMIGAVADLVDPAAVAREMPWLTGELAKIASGRSDVSFDRGDQRFSDEAWRTVPYFRVLGQSYRLFEVWMNRMRDSVDGSWQNKARARFAADVISAALSPTNYLGTNPAALRRAVETGGMSLVSGAQNMLKDMARGGMPAAADRKPFVVGENIACTPGAVVYRDEMFELLQYAPTTPRVRGIPLLMIPPQINRHYILDLAPGRSVAEFAVSQGIQAFMIVWRNPSALLGPFDVLAWNDDATRTTARPGQLRPPVAPAPGPAYPVGPAACKAEFSGVGRGPVRAPSRPRRAGGRWGASSGPRRAAAASAAARAGPGASG